MIMKNIKQITKLKKELEQNGQIQWDDLSNFLMLGVIDEKISNINNINALNEYFIKEIKPKRLNSIKKLIKDKKQQIKTLEHRLESEKKLVTPSFIENLTPDKVSEVIFYDNNKKWIEKSIKLINQINTQIKEHEKELYILENSNEGYILDEQGKIISRNNELENSYKTIIEHIQANLSLQLTSEKLKSILAKSNEDEEDDDFNFK
ncbi:hypothetical protein [Mycoplasma seminis]|uniref:Uncharacterized protein n=1 Tax=Mycoplasma seminis TaxID=512749 RepID=A0ABY9HC83_9MOLU|nr:hypothetical protein [Mycoplasma seminis]WLP85293.1 hypothetical protein Q8852_03140 [Mycoplasma seminis]